MAIQQTKKNKLKSFYEVMILDNAKQLLTGLTVIAACALILVAYRVWDVHKKRVTQRDFGALITQYDIMLKDKNAQWSELLEKFDAAYEAHAGSYLLPYYKGYKVQILLQQNKKEEAIALLNTLTTDLPLPAMAPLYTLERSLIKLDSADTEMKKQGEEELKAAANDKNNQFHDSALFYLGRYYWSINAISQARDVWQQLVDEQRDEKLSSSPWTQQVKEYLKLTIV
jgi:hypothetical protein